MTTIKAIHILNQLSNSKAILIPSYTGEYIDAETNYCSLDEPNIAFYKSEPWVNFQGDSYTSIQEALDNLSYDSIAYIKTSEIKAYFNKLCSYFSKQIGWSIKNHHMGDDTLYDYMPDLYSMIQYAAYGLIISSGDLDTNIQTLIQPIDDLITKFDEAYPDGDQLNDQCDRVTESDFLALNNHLMD